MIEQQCFSSLEMMKSEETAFEFSQNSVSII